MAKRVYLFNEGSKDDRELLGGKGANLCEMTNLGLPVPYGFIITTSTCREYFKAGNKLPALLEQEYRVALDIVEKKMGARFGDPENPLLFSVRSGAPVSMPGMMNTILNLGLNDEITEGLANKTGNARFAYDSYRRFIAMFADVVMGVDGQKFEHEIHQFKAAHGKTLDVEMSAEDWQEIIRIYKTLVDFPEDPFTQLKMAVEAVFMSWHTPRAIVYREMANIPDTLGTGVTVQAMVFGNFGDDSGSGVAFTRNPSTGEHLFFGEFLFNAAGEDVVSGVRTPLPVEALKERQPDIYDQLFRTQVQLEKHYRDMQDIEFTIQEGKLFKKEWIQWKAMNGLRQYRAGEVMTFDLPPIIEILSRPMPLLPGDIIATGTPRGVGFARKPPVFLRPGDVVECAIEGIGAIRNRIRG